tara:strand:+ start:286 stop:459 length:174 start_codon:yes stop_codon:yes gene_type:complete
MIDIPKVFMIMIDKGTFISLRFRDKRRPMQNNFMSGSDRRMFKKPRNIKKPAKAKSQ